MWKKCMLCLLAAALMVGGFAVQGDHTNTVLLPEESEDAAPAAPAGALVAASGDLELYYTEETTELVIKNRATGQTISSSAANNGMTYNSDYVKNVVGSLAAVSYTTSEFSGISESYLRNISCDITADRVENGLDLKLSFPDLSFGFTLELRLSEGYLEVALPESGIWETGEFYLCSVSPLPFLAAGQDTDDGYVFYPDGSGALYRFKNAPIGKAASNTWAIYAEEDSALSGAVINAPRRWDRCALPVFGIKRGDAAFLGVVTEGEVDTTITLSPSGRLVNLSRIGCSFQYRTDTVYTTDEGEEVMQVRKQRIGGDRAVRYYFLWGEEANYSAMAGAYRGYLLENGRLNDAVTADTIPLSLNLFMGIEKKTMLFSSFVSMTSFSEAETIAASLYDAGVTAAQLNLIGWNKGGYGVFSNHSSVESRLGGTSGLTALSRATKKRGYTLFAQENYVDVAQGDLPTGFSIRQHAVYLDNGSLLTDQEEQRYLASSKYISENLLPTCLRAYAKLPGVGIQLERIGATVYASTGSAAVSRVQTVTLWESVLQQVAASTGTVAATEGNAYCLPYADRLYDVPTTDSGYLFTDESIPFMQMVLHSYIPYSGQPGNLSSDFAGEKLRWVEYGCVPHFEITWERSGLLKDTDYSFLFTSRYADWEDTLIETAREFNARLSSVWDQEMQDHVRLSAQLSRVTYADGTKVYINYAQTDSQVDGYTVPAGDYLVVSSEGGLS